MTVDGNRFRVTQVTRRFVDVTIISISYTDPTYISELVVRILEPALYKIYGPYTVADIFRYLLN